MIRACFLALIVAATNVAVSQWSNRRGTSDREFWWAQGLKFLFRFTAIFGGATLVWMWGHRMPEVVAFIIAGAIAQMVGQIYFLTKRAAHARRSGRGT